MPHYRHQDLRAWQDAHKLALDVSQISRRLPLHERYDLADQLRRAARSIAANLAEGAGSQSSSTFLRHIAVALGSIAELDNHLICARDEGYMTPEACTEWRGRLWKVRGLVLFLAKSLRRARQSK